jgi:glycosyltransferase 2 family protein
LKTTVNRKTAKWLLQLVLTVALMYFAFQKVDVKNLKDAVLQMNLAVLSIIPILLFGDMILNSYRVRKLYSFYSISTNFWVVLKVRFQSMFFSLLFPFFGDAFNIQTFKNRYKYSYQIHTIVIFLDRIIYTLGLTLILIPFILITNFQALYIHPTIEISIFVVFIFLTIIILTINNTFAFNVINKILIKLKLHKFVKLQNYYKKAYYSEILKNTIIAILRHFLMCLTYLIITFAIIGNIDFNIFLFIMIAFFIMISRVLPISVGGIGLREYIAVLLFPQIGIHSDIAFLVGFLMSMIMIFQGLIGGMYYLSNRLSYLIKK